MGILDFIIIGLAVLFLIIGLLLGMRRMLFGIVAAIVAIVLAAVVMAPLGDAVMKGTGLDEKLTSSLAQSLSAKMPNGNQTLVYADADGDPETKDELGFFADGVWHPFADSLEGGSVPWLAKTIESSIRKTYTQEESVSNPKTYILIMSEKLTTVIFYAVAFLILWIVFGVAFWGLGKLVKHFVTGTYAGKLVDKVLGAVIGVAVIWVIIMLVFSLFDIVSAIPQAAGVMSTVNDMISSSTIGSLISQNNFIAQIINVPKIVASLGGGAA